jgi:PKD repeat protein
MRASVPPAARRAVLLALAALAGAAAACSNPIFPQYDGPSVGLTTNATNAFVTGTAVTFTVTAAVAPNSINLFIRNIQLDFGDGQVAELGTTAGAVQHVYIAAGTFTATATVTDTDGSKGKATLAVVVSSVPLVAPSAGLTSSATNPTSVGTPITFQASASIPGNPANVFVQNVHLDFGDGQSVDLGTTPPIGGVVHQYAVAGTYIATSTVTATNGASARASTTIVVR